MTVCSNAAITWLQAFVMVMLAGVLFALVYTLRMQVRILHRQHEIAQRLRVAAAQALAATEASDHLS